LVTIFLSTNLNQENHTLNVDRKIAAVDTSSCVDLVQQVIALDSFSTNKSKKILNTLSSQHPDLSKKFLKQKISAIDNEFMFYRSFVPFFYQKLQSNLADLNIPPLIQSIKAKALGDLHMDNFGALIKGQGRLFYGANDPDYANVLPLYADVLRYFTGAFLDNKKLGKSDFKKLLQAYQKGLKNQSDQIKVPNKVKDLSVEKLSYPADEIDEMGNLVRTVKKFRIPTDLEQDELLNFKILIEQQLGGPVEILDSLKFLNVTGGSGGYMRYRFFIKAPDGTEFLPSKQIIELKEIPGNSKLPMSDNSIGIEETLNDYYKLEDPNLKRFYGVLNGSDTNFLIRPRWAELDISSASSLTGSKKQKYLEYQSYLIGSYHRNSLLSTSQLSEYLEQVDQINSKSWREWAKKMAKLIKKDFDDLKD